MQGAFEATPAARGLGAAVPGAGAARAELYDVTVDAAERDDLSASRANEARAMLDELRGRRLVGRAARLGSLDPVTNLTHL